MFGVLRPSWLVSLRAPRRSPASRLRRHRTSPLPTRLPELWEQVTAVSSAGTDTGATSASIDAAAEPASIDPTATVAGTAIIGRKFRPLIDGRDLVVDRRAEVQAGAWIGEYTIIGQGATIGAGSIIEDYVTVGPRSTIGPGVVVTARSTIGLDATVGADSVINGFVCDNSRIGTGCKISGELIHRSLDPSPGWDDPEAEEAAPVIGDGAFIGWRAVIVGGVNIGAGAYVCAGALVTKDVQPGYVAYGRNKFTHPSGWPGALAKSPFFGGTSAT
jgi:acetyltransferase-like isoleucine patch superfamily enzyme